MIILIPPTITEIIVFSLSPKERDRQTDRQTYREIEREGG